MCNRMSTVACRSPLDRLLRDKNFQPAGVGEILKILLEQEASDDV